MTARDHAERSDVATLGDHGLQGGSGVFFSRQFQASMGVDTQPVTPRRPRA